MTPCFFIETKNVKGNGGGNVLSAQNIIVRRTLAIGDCICASVVCDKLIEQGYDVNYQTHPAVHCVMRRHPLIGTIGAPSGYCDVNLDGAYERDAARRHKHFHTMFMEKANEQLARFGINLGPPTNCRPRLTMLECDRATTRLAFAHHPRPWIFLCPRSESYNVRQVPDGIWREAAEQMKGTKFWLGRHPAPPGIVDLKANHFDDVLRWIGIADLLVTVDTGPMHVAAALGVPIVAICQSSSPELHLSDQRDWVMVSPAGLDCLNCQQNVCPKAGHMPPCQQVDPGLIASWANAKLRPITNEGVSAVVSIYQPEVGVLNRCLECLLPQVDEIIICSDLAGRVPAGAMTHDKIRYVVKGLRDIGLGRKLNYGARFTTQKFLLLVNDDAFLDPFAVARMRECMAPSVAAVSNLLRYPEGTIYHAGKARGLGQMGWGHRDYRQMACTILQPTEMENMCGCCLLVRREAFYDIGGFDEDFYLMAEDDDFCLRLRRSGWKLIFTPHSTGTHMEHQSVRKTGDVMTIVSRANTIFHRKWHRYLEHNKNTVPMGNFDY